MTKFGDGDGQMGIVVEDGKRIDGEVEVEVDGDGDGGVRLRNWFFVKVAK